jgi:hypothetical protein
MSASKVNARIARTTSGHGRKSPKRTNIRKWYLDPYTRYLPAGLKIELKKKEAG